MSAGGGTIILRHNSQVQADAECPKTVDPFKKIVAMGAIWQLPQGATVQDLIDAVFDALVNCP